MITAIKDTSTSVLASTDAEWQPTPGQPAIELFKLDSNGKQMLPEGQPEIVRPQFDLRKSFDDIKKNVSKMRSFISHKQNEWWEQLFDNPEGLLSHTKEPTPTKAPCGCVIEINQVTLALVSKCISS